ncbi:MAG: DUF4197 domain-containing protein [Xanthomonadales bacterium]|jgi:hypothetical protein|nr:DUF4197 domain-containing protein [Xanthomonadales bacterium]MCX7050585.1 DUF4197 domain-containing protein [Pseudomonadota bacterium]
MKISPRTPAAALAVTLLALACAWAPPSAAAAGVGALSDKDSVAGLKAALGQGTERAVSMLGATDGFLGNPTVRIPLPPTLAKGERMFKMLGLDKQAKELVTSMNRAAEAAMPEARTLLVDSVKQMSVSDARQILTGGDDAATQYFRRTSYDKLAARFLPIVKQTTDRSDLSQQYNEFAGQAARLGVIDPRDAKVEDYVTRKALDGLFTMIAEEERAIRKDPLGQSSKLLQSVFGSLKN